MTYKMSILDKVQIGSKVKVNLELSKDRLSIETIKAINTSSECTISDFKITDGKGVGVVLNLSNGKEEWFFDNEIEILDEKGNIIKKEKNKDEDKNIVIDLFNNLNYEPKSKFNELLNPINFMIWLIISFKDIL